ncbi:MAG: cellulase family glycosylhydrolase [Thermoanaerobaculales bacterium]
MRKRESLSLLKVDTKKRWLAGLLALATLTASSGVIADELVDDFEDPVRWDAWSFSSGPECPGATGDLERISGEGRNGSTAARLRFDYTDGGCYVAAQRLLDDVSSGEGISFWLAGAVAGTRLFVRLTDETGQIFESYLPMQSEDPESWVQYRVLADSGVRSWGGAGDGVFHRAATALTVLVDVGYGVHRTGSVLLDDVIGLSAQRLELDPLAAASGIAVLFRGTLHDRLGVNIHFAWPDATQLDLAAAAGLGWIRMDLAWDLVEQAPGEFDFTAYDALLDAVEARGMRALLILDYFNPIYCPSPGCDPHTGPATEEQRAAFAAFAAAAAARYDGREVVLEVWNEPNSRNFWRPNPDPEAYGRLAAETVAAVGAVSTSVPLVVGATAGVDVEFLDAAFAAADLSAVDSVSVHPYRSFVPESIGEDLALAREIVSARTGRGDIPLISGEWGYTAVEFGAPGEAALHRQAVAAVRELLSAQLFGLPLAIWYDLTNDCGDGTDWECNFGLLWDDGATPKPAWQAVAAMTRALPAGALRVSTCGHPPAVYCLVFRGASEVTAALWAGQKGSEVTLRVPHYSGVEVLDLYGAPANATTVDGMELTLREEDGPVYVRVPRGPRMSAGRVRPVDP